MKIRPLHDRIFVRRDLPAERIGGILVPEIARETQNIGTVVAIGPNIHGRPNSLREWQRVRFRETAGELQMIGGEEFTVMREDDVLGIYVADDFHPILDRVVIQREEPKFEGVILVPDEYKKREPMAFGTVLAMGPGQWFDGQAVRKDVPFEAGARILYRAKHEGAYDDLDLTRVIVREFDVFAVVDP